MERIRRGGVGGDYHGLRKRLGRHRAFGAAKHCDADALRHSQCRGPVARADAVSRGGAAAAADRSLTRATRLTPLTAGQVFTLDSLVTPAAQGIASRVLARTAAGNITLFAFDRGEELSEHTAPFDVMALTLAGALVLTIGGVEVRTAPQTIVLMPANVPHAVHATEASRMLLIMLRDANPT